MRAAGRQNLILTMRNMTAKTSLGKLDLTIFPDEAFLEPRLFSWHFGSSSQNKVNIAQMLFSNLSERVLEPLQVKSDSAGAVILAGRGTLFTDAINKELELTYNFTGISLADCGRNIYFEEIPRFLIPSTRIELVEHTDPVIQEFFSEYIDENCPLTLIKSPSQHLAPIEEALSLIKICTPNLHNALMTSLRSIVLFQHPVVNSFAALQLHGMIFLNVCRPATTVFFLDGLVHQGGHVIFSEATLNRQDYFKVHPDTKIETISGRKDSRSVYEALHGLYTEYALIEVMDRARRILDLDPSKIIELQARTAFILQRLNGDLQHFSPYKNTVFSSEGMEVFAHFERIADQTEKKWPSAITFDFEGQPNEFDLDKFLRKNSRMELT